MSFKILNRAHGRRCDCEASFCHPVHGCTESAEYRVKVYGTETVLCGGCMRQHRREAEHATRCRERERLDAELAADYMADDSGGE